MTWKIDGLAHDGDGYPSVLVSCGDMALYVTSGLDESGGDPGIATWRCAADVCEALVGYPELKAKNAQLVVECGRLKQEVRALRVSVEMEREKRLAQ